MKIRSIVLAVTMVLCISLLTACGGTDITYDKVAGDWFGDVIGAEIITFYDDGTYTTKNEDGFSGFFGEFTIKGKDIVLKMSDGSELMKLKYVDEETMKYKDYTYVR